MIQTLILEGSTPLVTLGSGMARQIAAKPWKQTKHVWMPQLTAVRKRLEPLRCILKSLWASPVASVNIGIGNESALCGAAEEASPTESSPAMPESRGAALAEDSAQPAASTSGSTSEDIIDIEGGAVLATRWGGKLRDLAGGDRADAADLSRTFVVKPTAVGLGSVPGEFVFVVTGLPQAALGAHSLLSQVGCACCSAGTCAVDGPCCATLLCALLLCVVHGKFAITERAWSWWQCKCTSGRVAHVSDSVPQFAHHLHERVMTTTSAGPGFGGGSAAHCGRCARERCSG